MTHDAPEFWHKGLIAEWWANFNIGGPEIEYFGQFIEAGQPALDAGCGTGRLIIPWLQAGYDVDGCDASSDMVEHCRQAARKHGVHANLWTSPLHELGPPRRYQTIVVCGVLGLGTTRVQDQEALVRLYESLEPGGLLLLDNENPYAGKGRWLAWLPENQAAFPEPWSVEVTAAQTTADGTEFRLYARTLSFDSLDQSQVREMRAEKWHNGELIATENHAMTIRSYFRDELLLMLERAGFADINVRGGYADEPNDADDFLVFSTRK